MAEGLDDSVFRREDWQQRKGTGIVELRGGDLEIALFINGAPLVYDAADCAGSIGRFMLLFAGGHPLEETQAIAQAAAEGFTDSAPLHRQVAPLLRLLPNGYYRLRLERISYKFSLEIEGREPPLTMEYYPDGTMQPILLWTQPESSLDENTLNQYLSLIERGNRPALITLGSHRHGPRFILDGHHKLFAYWCCGIDPHVLHIEFQQLNSISEALARSLLESELPVARGYLKQKAITRGPSSCHEETE